MGYRQERAVFDLDHNGLLDSEERSQPGFELINRRVISDTGYTLAPIAYIPVVIVFIGLNYALFFSLRLLFRRSGSICRQEGR